MSVFSGRSFTAGVVRAGLISAATLFAAGTVALAQAPATGAVGANRCYEGTAPVSQQDMQAFIGQPDGLLQRYPTGNNGMSSEVRNIVMTDGSTLDAMVGLISQANLQQRYAIMAGLGQATIGCQVKDALLALRIQQAVARLGDRDLETAYLSTLGTIETATIRGGALGGGGFGGPVGASFGSGLGYNGLPTAVPQRATNSFTGGGVEAASARRTRSGGGSGVLFAPISP